MLSRPLVKRGHSDLDWFMCVREAEHTSGISYSVFEWSFGEEDGMRGGELYAYPIQKMLFFVDRRASESSMSEFKSVEAALTEIDKYGWGEPPHIDEVFQDVLAIQEELQRKGVENSKEIFLSLEEKWMNLITSDNLLR